MLHNFKVHYKVKKKDFLCGLFKNKKEEKVLNYLHLNVIKLYNLK